MQVFLQASSRHRLWAAVIAVSLLGACAGGPTQIEPHGVAVKDPYEVQNRKTFAFNQRLSSGKQGGGVAATIPPEFRMVVNNFSENLSMPQVAVNSLLQGDLRGTGLALHRFSVNTVLGMGGLVDAASEFGVPEHDTDFGETLHVWGVGEGAFVMLPFTGASTQRDVVGRVVDRVTNPLSYHIPEREGYVVTAIGLADAVITSSDTAKPATYEAARAAYLERRRAEVSSRLR